MDTATRQDTVLLRAVQICAVCGCLCHPGEIVARWPEYDRLLQRPVVVHRHGTPAACERARARSAAFWKEAL